MSPRETSRESFFFVRFHASGIYVGFRFVYVTEFGSLGCGGKAFQALVGSSGLGFGASVVAGCMLFELLLTVRVSRF